MNNNHNNVFYLKNHKVYNTLCPANSYNANLGKKVQIKALLTYIRKNEKKTNTTTHRKKNHTQTRAQGFCCQKKRLKLQLKVYTTYQVKFLKYSIK